MMSVNKVMDLLIEGSVSFKAFAEKIVREIEGEKIEVPKFQEEWVHAALRFQHVVIAAARGHGKTLCMGVLLPLYIATYNANKTFLIISPTEDRSFEILQKIRYVIENNQILKFLRPLQGAGAWTKTKLDTSNHCQFYCRCMSPNIRGFHPDYLLVEEAGQIFDIDTFMSVVLPTIFAKKGKCVAIGTPESYLDLLHKLKRNKAFTYLEYPALDKDGNVLWPERFSKSDLNMEREKIGSSRFAREYLLRLDIEANQAFPTDLVMASLNEDVGFSEAGDSSKNYFMGIDLAYSAHGDYSVYTVLEQISEEKYRLVYAERLKGVPPADQIVRIMKLCDKFMPKRIVIDKSLFGQSIVNDMMKYGYPVEGFDFSPYKRSMLLFSLQRAFRDKKIELAYDESVQPIVKILLKELSNMELKEGKYKTIYGHDDFLISLALAYYASSKYKTCLAYGISNPPNIYSIRYNYESRSYIEQIERRAELVKKHRAAFY